MGKSVKFVLLCRTGVLRPPDWKMVMNIMMVSHMENSARVRNCPDITILNSLSVFCLFLLFVFFFLFVFLCGHHIDQISDRPQVSKVTLCFQIIKWHSVTTKGRYRAARAAKKIPNLLGFGL